MGLTSRLPEIILEIEAAVRAAELAGAKMVEQSAKDRAPVDKGDLRDAIHTEEADEGVYVIAGGKTANDRDVFYAHMVEHGTTHSAAEPFLVPALEENRAAIEALTGAAIRKVSG